MGCPGTGRPGAGRIGAPACAVGGAGGLIGALYTGRGPVCGTITRGKGVCARGGAAAGLAVTGGVAWVAEGGAACAAGAVVAITGGAACAGVAATVDGAEAEG